MEKRMSDPTIRGLHYWLVNHSDDMPKAIEKSDALENEHQRARESEKYNKNEYRQAMEFVSDQLVVIHKLEAENEELKEWKSLWNYYWENMEDGPKRGMQPEDFFDRVRLAKENDELKEQIAQLEFKLGPTNCPACGSHLIVSQTHICDNNCGWSRS